MAQLWVFVNASTQQIVSLWRRVMQFALFALPPKSFAIHKHLLRVPRQRKYIQTTSTFALNKTKRICIRENVTNFHIVIVSLQPELWGFGHSQDAELTDVRMRRRTYSNYGIEFYFLNDDRANSRKSRNGSCVSGLSFWTRQSVQCWDWMLLIDPTLAFIWTWLLLFLNKKKWKTLCLGWKFDDNIHCRWTVDG